MRKISYFGAIFLVFSYTFLLFAAGNTVFGPVQLTINAWHTHFSSHKFEVTDPQKGILSLKNDSTDKKVNGGLVWFNGALISCDLKKNPVFEKEVDLKKSNYLIVFLEGTPRASATLEVRRKDVNPLPTATFTANPQSIRPNQTSTLSWTTQNATNVTIDQGIGSVALNGSLNVTPLVNTAYTLTAQGAGGTITKTATVMVVNQAPVAAAQTLTLNQDTILAITLTGTDADNDPLTYQIVTNPSHGTLSGTAPSLTYTPSSGFYGADIFTFKVNDGYVDSATATISLTINHVNHLPKANAQALILNQDSSLAITLTGSDIDNDPLTYSIVTNPAHGTLTGTTPNVTYTPSSGFYGTDSFTFKVNDSFVDSAPATISLTINHVSDAPSVSLSAAPVSVPKGSSTTLTWNSNNANKANLDNGLGTVTLAGSQVVTPDHTTTYTITVIGSTGCASASVTVTVLGNPEPQPDGSFGQKYEDLVPPDATIEKYDPKRFSLVTGKVLDLTNAPLSDVLVTVFSHPEYGTAKTDNNGQYTIPVEGGGVMTFVFQKPGFLTSHRQVHVPWNDFAVGPTIQMLAEDPKATTIVFDGNANNIQTHQSTIVTDSFGARSCTMVFTGDNQAYAVDENGNDIAALPRIITRATEYVTPDSMPAILPPTSAYTYCAELSVDGAQKVRFAKPVITWVDNFLGFPVGEIVPVGYYDRDKSVWIASDNGVVVKLLDTDNDGIVDALDNVGDGQPHIITAGNSFKDEVKGLGDPTKYKPGKTFWRVPIQHFSPGDWNWPYGPPPDATSPNPNGMPNADQPEDNNNDCPTGCGSSIDDRSRTLHQDIHIPGTDITLEYASSLTGGNKTAITIPASGSVVPDSLQKILVQMTIAGRMFTQTLNPLPNQKVVFYWGDLDNLGREMYGPIKAHVKIGFQYSAVYYSSSTERGKAFSQFGSNTTVIRGRQDMYSWQENDIIVYATGGQKQGTIAEGWTLSNYHYLNPADQSAIYKGDGTIKATSIITASVLDTIAGDGQYGFSGDGGPATSATFSWPYGMAVDSAGNLYIADSGNNRIRKVDNSGITTIAGNGQWGYDGDGSPAVNAALDSPNGVAVDSVGNLYIADSNNNRVRKINTNGIITTVAGNGRSFSADSESGKVQCDESDSNGQWVCGGDGGPAVNAYIDYPKGVAVDSVGNLYITGDGRVRKVDTNGIITTVAGNGKWWGDLGDGGPAINAELDAPGGIAVDSAGNLYIADSYNNRIRKVDTSGIITTIAGNGQRSFSGDDGRAIDASLFWPSSVTIDSTGNLYIVDKGNYRIRKVDTSGIITTIAGNGQQDFSGDGGPAVEAALDPTYGIAVNAAGDLYIVDTGNQRIRRLGPPRTCPTFVNIDVHDSIFIADENGLGYIMSASGLHKYTIDLESGLILLEFGYDSSNRLVSITDRFGRQTVIQRSGPGMPISVVSPDGLVTTLTFNVFNRLTSVTYEDGGHYYFVYNQNGLMTQKIDPDGHQYNYQYDSDGKITTVSDEVGGEWRFARQAMVNGDIITQKTTAEGDFTTYVDHTYSTGAYASTITDQTGAQTTYSQSADGLTVQKNLPCGMQLNVTNDIDPIYKFEFAKQIQTRSPAGLVQTTQYAKTYQDTNNDKIPDLITDTITVNNRATKIVNNTLTGQLTLTSPLGRTMTTFYNPTSLLTSSTQVPGLYATNYTYDLKGRLTTLKTNTRETDFSYNTSGFLASITDPKQQVTSYDYDPVGRIKVVHRPDQSTVNFQYDPNGNMTVLTTPNQIDHEFTYNKVDRNDAYVTPKSGTYQYLYDRDRKLTGIKFPSGFDLKYIYDQGRLIQIQTEDQVIGLSYLCADKVGTIFNGQDSIDYGYDGSLVTSEALTGTLNQTLGYTYNNNFQIQGFTYAGGSMNYVYDNDQLLTQAGSFTITRDSQNGLPKAVGDGKLNLTRTFNGYGEINAQKFAVNNLESAIWNLGRNDNGQITSKQMTVNGVTSNFTYTYDPMGRLLTVTKDGTLVEQYNYGANGARSYEMNALKGITGRNYTYSNEDQVITAGDVTYKYDVDGFLAYKIKGTETTEYEYATRGELMKVTLPNGNVIEYVNDPLGRRIAKKINGVITEKYLWQGMTRLLAVYDGANNLLERFVYADSRLPMAMQSGGNTFYLAYDQVGSLISMTDASGNVVRSVTYDSFGNIIQDSDPNALMPFGFAAGLYDPDTGLVRFGFREYSPEIGRWTAKDPILFAGGVDLYGYCINDPVNFIDSIGLDDTPDNSGGYWQYSQSEGRIAFIMSDGTPIYYGEGYSGHHGGVNEPLVQSTQDFGPIPRGWWYITPINHPNYRPPVMSLTPTVETETYRRSLFLIHGDNACLCQSASTGCIILEVNIREIISHSPYHFLKVVW